jgi:hypothetical protein
MARLTGEPGALIEQLPRPGAMRVIVAVRLVLQLGVFLVLSGLPVGRLRCCWPSLLRCLLASFPAGQPARAAGPATGRLIPGGAMGRKNR